MSIPRNDGPGLDESKRDTTTPSGKGILPLGAGAGLIAGWLLGNPGAGMVLGAACGVVIRGLANRARC